MCVKLGLAYSKRVFMAGSGFFWARSVQMPVGPLHARSGGGGGRRGGLMGSSGAAAFAWGATVSVRSSTDYGGGFS